MISIENLTKSFGGRVLFEGITFKVNSRERVGLVGRNGHGKTTLLRIIAGKESQDSGTLSIPKFYRIGYVRQKIEFSEDTILREGMKNLPVNEKDHHWKVEKILSGLGFSDQDMQRRPEEFSGGFQVRLNLAGVLVSEPDMLLLDEPTNFLDITSIRWVKNYLVNWPGELILITHDRGFMDDIVTHTVAIHRKKVRKIAGNTEKLYDQLAQEEEIYEKTRINDERKRKEIEQFITRFRAKARLANLVQSRIKTLEKMEKKEKLVSMKSLDFSFRYKPFNGKRMMTATNVCFSYDPNVSLIHNFNIHMEPGERICVVGPNGRGKTTLLKLFAGDLTLRKGQIDYHPETVQGFYEQTNRDHLIQSRTVEDEILYAAEDMDRQRARNICGAMMFSGDDALKKISVLSGGEKSRVLLGKLLAVPANLLLLDEPTNHLDMESCDALLAAIDDFEGSIIMVTHNEMFLHAIARRLIVFQNDRITVFDGSYRRFLEKGGWDKDPSAPEFHKAGETSVSIEKSQTDDGLSKPGTSGEETKLSKKAFRRLRSDVIARKSKALKPLENRIAETEKQIEHREQELEKLNAAMQDASGSGNGEKIAQISRSLHRCQEQVDSLYDQLETLMETYEQNAAVFEKELDDIDRQEPTR